MRKKEMILRTMWSGFAGDLAGSKSAFPAGRHDAGDGGAGSGTRHPAIDF